MRIEHCSRQSLADGQAKVNVPRKIIIRLCVYEMEENCLMNKFEKIKLKLIFCYKFEIFNFI